MNHTFYLLSLLIIALPTRSSLGQESNANNNQPVPETPALATKDSPIHQKLRDIVIPSIDLRDTPLPEVIAFLQAKSYELDHETKDPASRGINIVLLAKTGNDPDRVADPSRASVRVVTGKFTDIPLGEALNFVAQLTACRVRVDTHAVVLIPLKPGEMPDFAADDPKLIAMQRKHLSSIFLPSLEFVDTPFRDAIEFLTQKAHELDPRPPTERGFNLVNRPRPGSNPMQSSTFDPDAESAPETARLPITLRLNAVPVLDALQYTAALAGCEVIIGNTMVIIQPVAEDHTER